MTAAMTNTGFVALPILHSIYGQPAVLPAALATVFVAAVMFPASVILLEGEGRGRHGSSARPLLLVRQIVLNPMVLSILVGSRVGDCRLAHSGAEEKYLTTVSSSVSPRSLSCVICAIFLCRRFAVHSARSSMRCARRVICARKVMS
jgi:malonate transporter and related proteins